jgi:type I restriction enzyme S subunit
MGYPYVTIPQLVDGRINLASARKISAVDFRDWTRRTHPQAYDVVVVRRCNSGDTAFVAPGMEFALGQNLVLLRADGVRVIPEFLRWLARGPQWWEQVRKFINAGAIFDSLKCVDIPCFELTIPPRDEQVAMSTLVGALDDKVEVNRRMNETLEAMARALFKSWFVDFDPVRAKAEGRALAGVDEATAALFPSGFEDSDLGEIPAGWETTPLETAGTWMSGGTPSKSRPEYWGGQVPWVSAKSLSDAVWVHDAEEHVTILGAQNGTRTVPRGSVLFVVRGMSLASEFRIGLCSREVTFNQDLKAIVPTGRVHPALLTLWLRESSQRILDLADEASHGTKRLQTDALAKLQLVLPPRTVQERLAAPIDALLGRIAANDHEMTTLRAIRDLLLPRLLSGELRVREAERIMERAV